MFISVLRKIHNFITAIMLTTMGFIAVMFFFLQFLDWYGVFVAFSLYMYSRSSRSKDAEEIRRIRRLFDI